MSTPSVEGIPAAVSVILVHGAWFDGSSWSEVIARLQARGVDVTAVHAPLQSLSGDVAVVERAIARQRGRVVLVGHGWGGTVITQAGHADRVGALVYMAAFAPDRGESTRQLREAHPLDELAATLRTDADGYLHLPSAEFPHFAAQDLPSIHARVLAAVQAPIHAGGLEQAVDHAAWRGRPAWYVVAAQDRMLSPRLQREMARRMRARVLELPASHALYLSRPRETTRVILDALATLDAVAPPDDTA